LFVLEHGIKIGAEARAGLGGREGVKLGESVPERDKIALAVGAGGQMEADLAAYGTIETLVKEFGKAITGLDAVHVSFSPCS
jgi:hypothetical protein